VSAWRRWCDAATERVKGLDLQIDRADKSTI
jgi:hypothetical protein